LSRGGGLVSFEEILYRVFLVTKKGGGLSTGGEIRGVLNREQSERYGLRGKRITFRDVKNYCSRWRELGMAEGEYGPAMNRVADKKDRGESGSWGGGAGASWGRAMNLILLPGGTRKKAENRGMTMARLVQVKGTGWGGVGQFYRGTVVLFRPGEAKSRKRGECIGGI